MHSVYKHFVIISFLLCLVSNSKSTLQNVTRQRKTFDEVRNGTKWQGGIVKYVLNGAFSEEEKKQIQQAIKEYHVKTCVRFQEKGDDDINFVEFKPIEWSHHILPCHLAQKCMRGGRQLAWFGQSCRDSQSIIHALGHILCLGHSENAQSSPPDSYHTAGLTRQDANITNEVHNCKCHRHEWHPISRITPENKRHMYSFGLANKTEASLWEPLYPCRVAYKSFVIFGSFTFENGYCKVWYPSPTEENVWFLHHINDSTTEVLTIPGGLSAYALGENEQTYRFQYELVDKRFIPKNILEQKDVVPVMAQSSKTNIFVAFGSFSVQQGKSIKLDVIGTALKVKALFAGVNKQNIKTNYKLIICKKVKV